MPKLDFSYKRKEDLLDIFPDYIENLSEAQRLEAVKKLREFRLKHIVKSRKESPFDIMLKKLTFEDAMKIMTAIEKKKEELEKKRMKNDNTAT